MIREDFLYTIPSDKHDAESIKAILAEHPEVKFVSLVAVDSYGQDTDEKIPVSELSKNPEKFLKNGVQTDGSSVLLPLIADIANGNVKLIPDCDVNWFVDYNGEIGTLRIPAFLLHNEKDPVGSRVVLKDAMKTFKEQVLQVLADNPYVFDYIDINSVDEIEDIVLTSATEMEFYVMTPQEVADKDRLHTSQEMKEQYWKRTVGPVRSALEETLLLLDKYGFGVEMGHKEVGGIKPVLAQGGDYDHIMEQLEIDWKFSNPMQAADNDKQIRYFIKDVFNAHGLNVTFMAKPVEGAAGSGKHTHCGVAAKLKDGRTVNLYSPKDPTKDYISPVGFGAIMGLLKNYEVINPIANCTTDALNRLKPGYEAPICAVTSLGKDVFTPSRNRTVLAGLVRDPSNPMATRFELRSPNPKSNTYLVVSAVLMAMLDGIKAAISAHKTPDDLLKSISKSYAEDDFYLESRRVYRVESNIFDDFTPDEREMLFGKSPATVWENVKAFKDHPEKTAVLLQGAFDQLDIDSFTASVVDLWVSDLHDRIVPALREKAKKCVKLHDTKDCADIDKIRYEAVLNMMKDLIQDTSDRTCVLTQLSRALEEKNYDLASDLQIEAIEKSSALEALYSEYGKNILCG